VDFVPAFLPVTEQPEVGWWFIFCGDKLLVKEEGAGGLIPSSADIRGLMKDLMRTHGIGRLDGKPCYASEVPEEVGAPRGMTFEGLRTLLGRPGEEIFSVAGRAFQYLDWDRTHQYCGRCGGRTESRIDEPARSCPGCGLTSYPEVTPAVIVAVIRGEEILLARSRRFQGSFFSVLAGFVEAGETFEECVKREVREEVAIEVNNILYFGSQPWPFPHSLMVGFTAEYEGGEISIDDIEISEAGWFAAEALPEVSRKGTIARRLIDWFRDNHRQRLTAS
jgi:NAD+ diphosphatase